MIEVNLIEDKAKTPLKIYFDSKIEDGTYKEKWIRLEDHQQEIEKLKKLITDFTGRRLEFVTDAKYDYVSIFVNNKVIKVSFDENKYNHKDILIADSGSIFEYCIQEKTSEIVRKVRDHIKNLIEEYEELRKDTPKTSKQLYDASQWVRWQINSFQYRLRKHKKRLEGLIKIVDGEVQK